MTDPYKAPVIYDINTDKFRLVTQRDIQVMEVRLEQLNGLRNKLRDSTTDIKTYKSVIAPLGDIPDFVDLDSPSVIELRAMVKFTDPTIK